MISLNWCSDYVDIKNENPNELAVKITKAGVNVEKVVNQRIENLVIGQIKSVKKHSNSDHLNICIVDIGTDTVQIVCGAPNVKENLKVLVALPGCILPGDFEIKKGVIRGEESNGMICALFELGLEEKTEENYAKGIEELNTDLKPGTDANIYLGTDDVLYELDIHKHRNNDCYYHIGFAYEIASILSKKVKLPVTKYNEEKDKIDNYVKLDVKTDKCPYYLAKMVTGVTIKESPDFIKKRLNAYGMRSINNVVDISNYVMLEYGQPLHFFDKEKLGGTILVRDAKEKEETITLDEEKRILSKDDIVITNGKDIVAIGGVMGSLNSDIDENTKDIVIESAIFDPVSVRYTAAKLNLKSEASIRFGKGLSYEYTKEAIDRACYLLEKYADAKVLSGMLIHDKIDKKEKIVTFKTNEVSTLLGLHLTDKDIKTELDRLMFDYKLEKDIFKVTIPQRRIDIDPNVNDIAEEIGRLYGYENLDSTLPIVPIKRGVYVGNVGLRKDISKRLRSLGLSEIKTYTLVSDDMIKMFNYNNKPTVALPNPMSSDKANIRVSLISSLINSYNYNKARKVDNINIYEIAKTYDDKYNEDSLVAGLMSGCYIPKTFDGNVLNTNFYTIKGVVENLLSYLGYGKRLSFNKKSDIKDMHPGVAAEIVIDNEVIGIIGKVSPSIVKEDVFVFELSLDKLYNKKAAALAFEAASKYPDIQKDVAFIIDKSISSSDIEKEIKKNGSKILKEVKVFDLYEGEKIDTNKKSIAYNLVFNDQDKTLTEEEVDTVFRNIINKVTSKFKCEIRDK